MKVLVLLMICPFIGQALDTEQLKFLSLINEYRVKNGAKALKVSSILHTASQWMANDMAARRLPSHTDSLGRTIPNRIKAFGYPAWAAYSENFYAGAYDATRAFNAFKNSPNHNMNMLEPSWSVVGIGAARGFAGDQYTGYWTTKFGSYVDEVIQTEACTGSTPTPPLPPIVPPVIPPVDPAPPNQVGCSTQILGSFAGCFFQSGDLSGSPLFSLITQDIGLNVQAIKAYPSNWKSAKWLGSFDLVGGEYTFTSLATDGVVVYLDGRKIIDRNQPSSMYWIRAVRTLSPGKHTIAVEYFRYTQDPSIKVTWVRK